MDDQELAAWARNWHWNDTAEDKPVDPSIYFRDMRMLKAFLAHQAVLKRKNCQHLNRQGNGMVGSDGSSRYDWYCPNCGETGHSETPPHSPISGGLSTVFPFR